MNKKEKICDFKIRIGDFEYELIQRLADNAKSSIEKYMLNALIEYKPENMSEAYSIPTKRLTEMYNKMKYQGWLLKKWLVDSKDTKLWTNETASKCCLKIKEIIDDFNKNYQIPSSVKSSIVNRLDNKTERKTKTIRVRMPKALRERLREYSSRCYMSTSEYIRCVALGIYPKTLEVNEWLLMSIKFGANAGRYIGLIKLWKRMPHKAKYMNTKVTNDLYQSCLKTKALMRDLVKILNKKYNKSSDKNSETFEMVSSKKV